MSASPESVVEIRSFLVTLEIDGKQSLVVLLSSDGTINRLGDGSTTADGSLYIGRGGTGPFEALRRRFDPKWIEYFGKRIEMQDVSGLPCLLRVLVELDGDTKVLECLYGSDSEGPPVEISQFAVAAVQITDPWYEEQKAAALKAKKPWWKKW